MAQIGEQQVTVVEILRQHGRHVHAGGAEQARYLDEGTAILVLGRRIHHNARAGRAGDAEVAAEAGILRRGSQRERLAGGQMRMQPGFDGLCAAQRTGGVEEIALLEEKFCAILSPNHTNKPRCPFAAP